MTVSLTALRAFETAARHLSFKLAANELNLSATAISHQVRSLEQALGHALFYRQVRRVSLTTEGEELMRTLTPAFQSPYGDTWRGTYLRRALARTPSGPVLATES